jgi:hypothetical protein
VSDDTEKIGMKQPLLNLTHAVIVIPAISISAYLNNASLKGSATSISLHSITTKPPPAEAGGFERTNRWRI